MIIEFTNTIPPKTHSTISVAIILATCAFFFIPTTLIVLGYLSSQPTGNLISPLPQGIISDVGAQRDVPTATPSPIAQTSQTQNAPIIAAPNEATPSAAKNVVPESANNIIDKTASVSAGLTEVIIKDTDIKTTSQIYLSPRPEDKATYSVKNKLDGQMTITVNPVSDILRYIDYHIVNP